MGLVTPATKLASEKMIAASIQEDERYPDHSAFVAADLPDFGKVVRRSLDDGLNVVIVFPDGSELLIPQERGVAPRPLRLSG
jgi:hypothetical protein